MATYDELRAELDALTVFYGQDWRRVLSAADVRAVDGYLQASTSTTRYEQSPTGVWEPSTGSSGQVGYVDPTTNIFYPTLAESTGDAPQVPDVLVGVLRNESSRAVMLGPRELPSEFLRTDEQQRGDAARAMKQLENAMELQHSDVGEADLELAQTLLQAHTTAQSGIARLNELQSKIDDYIAANPGLDTPTGAREFNRFLNGIMDEIVAVVLAGALDTASQAGVATALLERYALSEERPADTPVPPDDTTTEPTAEPPAQEGPSETTAAEGDSSSPAPSAPTGTDSGTPMTEPTLDQLMSADPGLLEETAVPAQAAQTTPAASAMPSLGGLGSATPSTGSTPTSGASMPSLPNLFGSSASEPDPLSDLLAETEPLDDEKPDDKPDEDEPPAEEEEGTVVQLPNGETVTAPNSAIANAITAAAGGTPVAEAYRQNGMVISPVGTAVPDPVDTADIVTGDVGVFSDHHVIALDDSKALVNTAVQPVDDVVGPGFLGWERPPEPAAAASSEAATGPDGVAAPTRVAAAR